MFVSHPVFVTSQNGRKSETKFTRRGGALQRGRYATAAPQGSDASIRTGPARHTSSIAIAEDSGTVKVIIPISFQGRTSAFIAGLESLTVTTDRAARVVVNERTGTIVIGGDVSIAPTSILHGALNVEVIVR